ncbi:MAG: trypsin-like peptidase domain-containing protein, partial [Synergistaceae bacterium]|nr:trypsin-like peptidase domain-containing protein [Synergistaceae bacterium]
MLKVFKLIAALSLIILFAQSELGAAGKKSVSKRAPAKTSQQASAKIPVEMDYAELVEKVMPSICAIQADNNMFGSGFFVSANGDILTNYHVVKGANNILVTAKSGKKFYALIKDFDSEKDIALLVPRDKINTPYLKLSSKLPRQGEAIMAAGNPQGFKGTVSNGIISAFRLNNQLLQFTAPISPGSSGGALINSLGEVVGMPTLQFKEGQNLNFALASSVLNEFLNKSKGRRPKKNAAAETLSIEAAYRAGLDYYNKKDYAKAFKEFSKAAQGGHAGAQHNLGFMYDNGQGVRQDYQQALYWYRKAAEQGLARAQNNLGLMYDNG